MNVQLPAAGQQPSTHDNLTLRIDGRDEGLVDMGFQPTRFFDVGGIPVKVEAGSGDRLSVMACDPAPRSFSSESVFRHGTEISRDNFDQMVKSCGGVGPTPDSLPKRLWPDDESPRERTSNGDGERGEARRKTQARPAEDC